MTGRDDPSQWARRYATRGWPILPVHSIDACGACTCGRADCSSPGKHPRSRHGLRDATTNLDTIEDWWSKWPDANVGLLTGAASGLLVLDIDPRHGGDDALHALEATYGELPATVQALTGGGGRHIVFQHVAGLGNGRGGLPDGIDVRGDGGYIVAPPSRHASGATYEWEPDRGLLDGISPAPPPSWLTALLTAGHNGNGHAPEVAIREGQRNARMFSLACAMRRQGADEATIHAALRADRRCTPPLDDHELRGIAASAMRYPPAGVPAVAEATSTATKGVRLPPVPEVGDVIGQCRWLTAVFALDPTHAITGGRRHGLAGPEGHVELSRLDAPAIRLEPFKVVNTPARLIEAVSGWALPTDGATPALRGEHCRVIAQVVRMLCGATETITAEQETAAIVSAYLGGAVRIEQRTTYGTSGERYEAARDLGSQRAPAYLLDAHTGAYVIRVSDLAESARRQVGASLPRGWLDGRLCALGWQRITLAGYAHPGREGRSGPHARCDAYRGHLPAAPDDGPVNT